MTIDTILVCTVGGSYQPIVTAIRELDPGFVCFICSNTDPGTGRPGSEKQITGKGSCIKACSSDEKPTLPSIPVQARLYEGNYEVQLVPADDLDGAVMQMRTCLIELAKRFPDTRIVADYTGGTKTMTAALVTAVLETDSVDLQLVTGNRADLKKVHSGTESSFGANIDAIRLERSMLPYLNAWKRYAYDEAAKGLDLLQRPRERNLISCLSRARDLSRAFAEWDRFNHVEARRLLDMYAPVISKQISKHLGTLRLLTVKSRKHEPTQLLDLWLNAQRRAAQGRYDDAVARVYRLLEWTAQWLLRSKCGVDTSDIPPDAIPATMNIPVNRKGKYQASLYNSWQLIEKKVDGAAARFAADKLPALLGHVEARNLSILAHGFEPIGRDAWEKQRQWIESSFLPMLLEETKAINVHLPPQLPNKYQWMD